MCELEKAANCRLRGYNLGPELTEAFVLRLGLNVAIRIFCPAPLLRNLFPAVMTFSRENGSFTSKSIDTISEFCSSE